MKQILFIFLIWSGSTFGDCVINYTDSSGDHLYNGLCSGVAFTAAQTAAANAQTEATAKETKMATVRANVKNCIQNWASLTAVQQTQCNLLALKLSAAAYLQSIDL